MQLKHFQLKLTEIDDPKNVDDELYKRSERKHLKALIELEKKLLNAPLMKVTKTNLNTKLKLEKSASSTDKIKAFLKNMKMEGSTQTSIGCNSTEETTQIQQTKTHKDDQNKTKRINPHSNGLKRIVSHLNSCADNFYAE